MSNRFGRRGDLKKSSPRFVGKFPWLKPLLVKLRDAARSNPRGPIFKAKNVANALSSPIQRLGLPNVPRRNLRAVRIKRLWDHCDGFHP